ncbi:MAG: alpha/beta hydrolase family esterase, partial [Actinomycetes bacterium]
GVDGISANYEDVPTAAGVRSMLVVEPDSLRDAPAGTTVPLVVVLHGLDSDAEIMAKITSMAAESAVKGFVAAFGVGLDESWNAGSCCGPSAATGVDDVAYVRSLILTLEASYPVDRSKVFLLGYSNGGMMAYRLLCESPELVTSFASVAGTNTSGCRPTVPRPFLQMSGDDDPIVPVEGSETATIPGVGPTPPVRASVAQIAEAFDCPASRRARIGPVTERRWGPCRDDVSVVFDIVDGAGHGWSIGPPFSTTQRVLQFWGLV